MWHNWSKRKRWLVSLAGVLGLGAVAAAGTAYYFLHVPGLPVPGGVTKRTQTVTLTGQPVKVDFYLPSSSGPAPLVIIAHGFSRNRKTMAGWGGMLAAHGFLAVVLDMPTLADHARNGRAVAELLARVQAGELIPQPKPNGPAALVGFSAGGLSTLLAAGGNTNVACWVGLDPVAMGAAATQAAESLRIPCFVLRAEPASWNANGTARRTFMSLPGPAFMLAVNQATHVDAECPTSLAADWICGQSDPARREVFGRYLLASVQVGLLRDQAAFRQLASATNDAAVREVLFRNPEGFQATRSNPANH
jgi:pimeloyl-ACP methyl ester carboxylesterase